MAASSANGQTEQYVNLGDAFYDYYAWTNDPSQMEIDTYFDPKKPNLAESYNIPGLVPVIKEKDGETYLLTDQKGQYYRWSSEVPGMDLLDKSVAGGKTPIDVAVEVMRGVRDENWHPQFRRAERRSEMADQGSSGIGA